MTTGGIGGGNNWWHQSISERISEQHGLMAHYYLSAGQHVSEADDVIAAEETACGLALVWARQPTSRADRADQGRASQVLQEKSIVGGVFVAIAMAMAGG